MANPSKETKGLSGKGRGSLGFLLAQVGAHAMSRFAERIKPLGLNPSHAGILRLVSQTSGISQRELAKTLSILPSRLVLLMDELENKGLVERRNDANDRRKHSLHLTAKGQKTMAELGERARAHGESLGEGLSREELSTLVELLSKVAQNQGLMPGVHPGYKNL